MYKLANGVFLVTGAKRGAIYDTNTGNVYSVNETACRVLLGELENPAYLKDLRAKNLLGEGLAEGLNPEDLAKLQQTVELKFIWFEILSDDCNECCIHCYAQCMPPTYRRSLGLSTEQNPTSSKRKLTAKEWKTLIKEGAELGCKRCQFIGGEPFLWRGDGREDVLDLTEWAISHRYADVEIFTNGTLLTEGKIERMKALGVRVAISLYAIRPKVHEAITKTPGSFRKTLNALSLLKKYGVPTRVETPLMKANEGVIEETRKWLLEQGFLNRKPDPIRPKGRADNQAIFPSGEAAIRYGYRLKPDFRADWETFTRYYSTHSCLAGKITITDVGDVIPCIFSRNEIAGNALEMESLRKVVTSPSSLKEVWHTTKDSVLVCQDCEYRYACFDCRPLSQGAGGAKSDYFSAPYPRCTYNPYTGEWASGAWKLDEAGKPYYDKDLKPTIEQVLADRKETKQPTPEERGECDGG